MKKNDLQETGSKEDARMLKDTETRKSSGACQTGPGTIAGLAGYEPGQTVLDLGSGAEK